MLAWRFFGGRNEADRAAPASWSVAITDEGLICGAGSILARLTGPSGQPRRLALETDGDRLLAMLSVVADRPVPAAEVLPHIAAASAHWQRGDKALANLRLIFAKLPRPHDLGAVERMEKAEAILAGGMAPQALVRALWPPLIELARAYDPDQPRIPAGHVHGGEWIFADGAWAAGARPARRLRVAQNDPPHVQANPLIAVDAEDFKHDAAAPFPTPDKFHFRIFDPAGGVVGGGVTTAAIKPIAEAFAKALATVGPGSGAVYGTAVHTQLKMNIRALGNDRIFAEESYKDGRPVRHGTPGSIRVDIGLGSRDKPSAVIDAKTGGASLDTARIRQLMKHLPDVSIIEMKP